MKKLSSWATTKLIGARTDQRAQLEILVARRQSDVRLAIHKVEISAKAVDRVDGFQAERRAAEDRLFDLLDADAAVGVVEHQRADRFLERPERHERRRQVAENRHAVQFGIERLCDTRQGADNAARPQRLGRIALEERQARVIESTRSSEGQRPCPTRRSLDRRGSSSGTARACAEQDSYRSAPRTKGRGENRSCCRHGITAMSGRKRC